MEDALDIRAAVVELGFDIYEPLTAYPEVVYTTAELEALLRHALGGQVFDAPIRTRAKLVKQATAKALGYPVPKSLKKTKPRFPGQDLDVYAQQSNNLQIWNDEISPTRRYAILGLDAASRVHAVRVIEGIELAPFDRTGTLTSKYQAKRIAGRTGSTLVAPTDTDSFIHELAPVNGMDPDALAVMSPADQPANGQVLTIEVLYRRLLGLIGQVLPYSPSERQRGELLHRTACEALGLGSYVDTGQFPDILCQALEVKLQSAGTIDLGLVSPSSEEPALTLSPRLRHCDARYLIAYATHQANAFVIDEIVVSTGIEFYGEFQQFGGLVQNKKLQLRLPRGFFDAE
ncbi:MAG TPA: hypothetical protein VHU86_05430 [Solirubrobacterales bacterium]|nr:hypothetical protein [Solirubrobacterales bacterium]